MGTRSTVHFYEDSDKTPLLSVYQQYDGYPSGVGKELAEFLAPMTVVNGFGVGTPKIAANGVGCLAAQFVAKFKTGIGGFYITSHKDSQEYDYHVRVKSATGFGADKVEGGMTIKVVAHGKKVFEGNPENFLDWCGNQE